MGNLSFLLIYLLLSFLLTFLLIPPYIRFLHRYKLGKQIREEALMGKATEFAKLHKNKTGTPTMGAGIILISIFSLVALSVVVHFFAADIQNLFGIQIKYSLWNRNETYLALFTLATVGLIGLVDDYLNVRGIGRTKGLSARVKMILLTIFALIGAYWFYVKLGHTGLHFPFLGEVSLGILYIPLFIFIIIAMANAVNITDGLDGLAGGLLLFNYVVYAFITYSQSLFILSAICMLIVGALIAFLWFNIKPARFYMGDIGSLALGANLGIMAMMTDTLAVLIIISGIYILEICSVIIQLTSKKLRNGKKIFRIAPFHHHLEAIGWSEETVVMRFWLIGMILSSIGLIVSFVMK
ncbi:TPA: phospho-N-acetylmuramoyl-pentapeptide-transferase [Candidatus Gracilibacteria bacterium]|nr:phospho-N-acetylmuramoyl-pentapeptide-transferase [Candidatus Gracilibacteria bacterium]